MLLSLWLLEFFVGGGSRGDGGGVGIVSNVVGAVGVGVLC